jgi:hypothetical protein
MVGLAAQTGATDPAQKSKTAKADTVTVTGCVADKDANGKYMLNNASMSDTSSTASSATGTTGSTAAETMSYELTGDNLKAHVGHKVEVTGTVQHAKMSKKASSDAGMTGSTATANAANNETLRVKSVKMISASCQ